MEKYCGTTLSECINIDQLYTVHYFEYSKNYIYKGEKHDFWEFVYVDKGEIIITADDDEFPIGAGKIFFHSPGQWHTLRSNGEIAPNIMVVSFSCKSEKMSFFENRLMNVGQNQKNLLAKIISEFSNSFLTPVDAHETKILEKREGGPVGSQQLLGLYLTELLINFIRNDDEVSRSIHIGNHINSNIEYILQFMRSNINRNVTLDEISGHSGMSRSAVSSLFSSSFGCGPIVYFNRMKIELAKKYIRENNYNLTQIAEMLGYSTIHYFSRQFKKITGMSPSQYSNSIRAMDKIFHRPQV